MTQHKLNTLLDLDKVFKIAGTDHSSSELLSRERLQRASFILKISPFPSQQPVLSYNPMALTRIDCDFFRGSGASAESSAYVALNPSRTPGSMVVGCSCATRTSLGSQVACKLALEHFVTGVLDFFESCTSTAPDPRPGDSEISLEVLEAAFKSANASVYQFGHSLSAGGRMSASLLGIVIQDRTVAAARVGAGSAYLCRNGDLFPFFEPNISETEPPPTASDDALVGAQSLVAVDLASVPIQAGDALLVFSERLDDRQERLLALQFSEDWSAKTVTLSSCVNKLFPVSSKVQFAMTAVIGPDSIYLGRPLEQSSQVGAVDMGEGDIGKGDFSDNFKERVNGN